MENHHKVSFLHVKIWKSAPLVDIGLTVWPKTGRAPQPLACERPGNYIFQEFISDFYKMPHLVFFQFFHKGPLWRVSVNLSCKNANHTTCKLVNLIGKIVRLKDLNCTTLPIRFTNLYFIWFKFSPLKFTCTFHGFTHFNRYLFIIKLFWLTNMDVP